MKDIYRWFDYSYGKLKEMDRVVGEKIRELKRAKVALHDDLRNKRVGLTEFTKRQASLNRQISRSKVNARHINIARLCLAGHLKQEHVENSRINWVSVLDIITSTMGFDIWSMM